MDDRLTQDRRDGDDSAPKTRMELKKNYKKQETRGWIFSIAMAVVVALLLRFFVFEFIRVDGRSMEPTLYSNEYVFMEKVSYWFDEPQYGDIVICSFPHRSETFVKRVIGTEGDVLRITDGTLYINDVPNTEFFSGTISGDMAPVTVSEDCVFVMGDNRNSSQDSRVVGELGYDMLLGPRRVCAVAAESDADTTLMQRIFIFLSGDPKQ